MSILFHHAAVVQPATFAEGLFPAPVARCKPFSSIDAAWKAGFDAAVESGLENEYADVYPPADYSAAEAYAFSEGAREGFREIEHEIELARQATATTIEEFDPWITELERRDALCGHA